MLKNDDLQSYSDYITHFFSFDEYSSVIEYSLNTPEFFRAFFKMVALDVDSLIDFLPQFYSSSGRPARNQIQIVRAFIVMVHYHVYSPKKWVKRLRSDPVMAILCGFDPDDVPGFASFYDFINRLYHEDKISNIQPSALFSSAMKDYRKDLKKNEKLDNVPEGKCMSIYESYRNNEIDERPEDNFLELFHILAVRFSVSHGLIDTSEPIDISGDGSSSRTHASSFGSSVDDMDESLRRYSDIDADIGWDSDLCTFYFGYSTYSLCYHNDKKRIDLPLFMDVTRASQHDSITAMTSLAKFMALNTEMSVSTFCHDSAADNYATHYLCYSLGISPVIDINWRATGHNAYEPPENISKNGRPICMAGYEMTPDGSDRKRCRHKFRCKYRYRNENPCPLRQECSPSSYGRVVYIKWDTDIKLFGEIPYRSKKWYRIYRKRTCCERVNNRILNDYRFLTDNRFHGRKRNLFAYILAGINIHLDAYYKVSSM